MKNIIKLLQNAEDKVEALLDEKTMEAFKGAEELFVLLCNVYLNDEDKSKMLATRNGELLSSNVKVQILMSVADEKIRLELLENHNIISELDGNQISNVLATMSIKIRKEAIISNKYNLDAHHLNSLASTLGVDELCDFLREDKEILLKNGIRPYKVVIILEDQNRGLEFISKMEEAGLTLGEKRLALLVLNESSKKAIDTSNLSMEYATVLQMEYNSEGEWHEKIKVDFANDLEIYRGLDELVYVDPTQLPVEYKEKLLELGEICPSMNISDYMGKISTIEDYKEAEVWVESLLQNINPEWTDIQKVAFIDNAIGKKISYSLDVDTELFDENGTRALWKTIRSSCGICAGVAQVEQYILSKVGIKSKLVSNDKHAFLKLEEISLPTLNGELVVGDTILDPTWNLASHRYGMMPKNFCKSYQEIRKEDINKDGKDTESHKKDEELSGVQLSLDEESLKRIFSSIGIADRQGNFPGKYLDERLANVLKLGLTDDEIIKRQLAIFEEYCPEFALCQEETITILREVVLAQREEMDFNECVIDRVYMRDDKEKKPIMYMYMNFSDIGEKFYFVDGQQGCFGELAREEFESKFECYDMDLEKLGGYRPWERDGDIEDINLKTRRVIIKGEEVR